MEISGPVDRREAVAVRREVLFPSGQDECAAWLYTAPDLDGPRPIVIMGHGLGAVREMRLDAYADRFADAGWSVLVFDYRHLGASGGAPRQLLDIDRQRADWHAALAFVRTLPEVDVNRIALWGSSFGGGHVLQVASEDSRIAAVVAQCPFTDGPASLRSRIRSGPLSAVALTVAGILDTVGSWFGAKPILLPMAGTSWMPAFVASPDALAGASALLPAGTRLSRRTSALLKRLPSVRAQLSKNIELTEIDRGEEPVTGVGRDSIWGVLRGADGEFEAANALAARLVLRLPLEVADLFKDWLARDHPGRYRHVMSILRAMRGGKDYDATFGKRMTGSGPYAWALGRRFELAAKRLGLNKQKHRPRTDLFEPPVPVGGQLSLF